MKYLLKSIWFSNISLSTTINYGSREITRLIIFLFYFFFQLQFLRIDNYNKKSIQLYVKLYNNTRTQMISLKSSINILQSCMPRRLATLHPISYTPVRLFSQQPLPNFSSQDILYAQTWLRNLSREHLPSDTQFDVSYARSSGPGGQNVNKVSTKATLKLDKKHWNIDAEWMPIVVRHVLFSQSPVFESIDLENLNNSNKQNVNMNNNGAKRKQAPKFPYSTSSGSLLVQSDRTRNRESNLEDCYAKLISAIQAAVHIPNQVSQATQEKWKAVKTKTNEKRLKDKKKSKEKKEGRRKNFDD